MRGRRLGGIMILSLYPWQHRPSWRVALDVDDISEGLVGGFHGVRAYLIR